jgi:hypothetical protein
MARHLVEHAEVGPARPAGPQISTTR